MLSGFLPLACSLVLLAEAEVAVGYFGAHPELQREKMRLKNESTSTVVGPSSTGNKRCGGVV